MRCIVCVIHGTALGLATAITINNGRWWDSLSVEFRYLLRKLIQAEGYFVFSSSLQGFDAQAIIPELKLLGIEGIVWTVKEGDSLSHCISVCSRPVKLLPASWLLNETDHFQMKSLGRSKGTPRYARA